MTYSGKIKEEVSKLECSKAEYISELSGIFKTSADIKLSFTSLSLPREIFQTFISLFSAIILLICLIIVNEENTYMKV